MSQFFGALSARFLWLSRIFGRTPVQTEVDRFLNHDGNKTHRLRYDLTADAVVCDLGGYEGQWTSDIFGMYCCRIFVFEPVPAFADAIKCRFKRNPRISVHNFGLAGETRKDIISLAGDASSLFRRGKQQIEVELVRASDAFRDLKIGQVDLMKINIEGGEYELLEHLIQTSLVKSIRNIQVQFHNVIPNAEERMSSIQKALAKTHVLTYQYHFVWENWRRKSDNTLV